MAEASCRFDVDFDVSHVWSYCCDRRCEVKFQSVAEVVERLILGGSLAGDVNVDALRELRNHKLFVVVEAFEDVADVVDGFKAATETKLHHVVARVLLR